MTATAAKIFWIAAAGSLGTLARYGISAWVQRIAGAGFPWGTVAVNLTGCLLFGVVWAAANEHGLLGTQSQTILLVGFFGAFTTFSSFAFETAQLLQKGQWGMAMGNTLLQNGVGIAALIVGIFLGRRF